MATQLDPQTANGVKQILLGAALKGGISPSTLLKAAELNSSAPTAMKAPTMPRPTTVAPTTTDFATGVLQGLGAKVTPAAVTAINDWRAAEGGPSDNPLNTTIGQGNVQGSAIKGYGTPEAGINATVSTLKNGLYAPVIDALRTSNDPNAIRQAIIASPWDGSAHYAGTDYAAGTVNAPTAGVPVQPTATAPTASVPTQPTANTPTASGAETTPEAITQALLASNGKGLSASQLLGAEQPSTALPPAAPVVGTGDAQAGATPAPPSEFQAMVADANKINSAGANYEWGGGHNPTFSPTSGTGHGSGSGIGYDCSGAISAILHAAGLLKAPMVAQQFMTYGAPGPGGKGDITIYASPTHVFAEINGRFFGTSLSNPGGGAGWFTQAATAGYTVRHVSFTGAPSLHLNTKNGNVIPYRSAQ